MMETDPHMYDISVLVSLAGAQDMPWGTMRFESTAKVLAKRMLIYYRIL